MQDAGAAFWLSPQQKHGWSVRSDDGSTANAVALVRLSGPLDPEKLRQAIVHAANRHEILRTVFRRHAGMKIPFQVVLGEMEPALEFAASASQPADSAVLFAAERTRPLSLEQGPVLQSQLRRISAEQHILILTLPEFCSDMRSLRDLVKEIGLLYADRDQELNHEPLQYRQFAQWRTDVLEADDPDAIEGAKFWQQVQAGCETPIALPLCAVNGRAFQKESLVVPCGSELVRKIESTQKHAGAVSVRRVAIVLVAFERTGELLGVGLFRRTER